jgi:hypothetical protein
MESGRAGTGSEREEERGEEESRSLRLGLCRQSREEWQGREKPSLDTSLLSWGGERWRGKRGRRGRRGRRGKKGKRGKKRRRG